MSPEPNHLTELGNNFAVTFRQITTRLRDQIADIPADYRPGLAAARTMWALFNRNRAVLIVLIARVEGKARPTKMDRRELDEMKADLSITEKAMTDLSDYAPKKIDSWP